MKIRRVAVFNFKSFADEVYVENVSPGANILIGKNGAGKSSILEAIKFVIDAHQRIGPVERRIFVNEKSKELRAHVEIEFENVNRAFPGGDSVIIRRSITQRSDEYTVDGREVSRDEMVSLYETAGISKTMPYFVVEQGKIGELAQMSGAARMELVRNLAGSAVYEKDKEEIESVLKESESIEQRIEELVKTIEKRVKAIEHEKERRERKREIEKKKELLIHELYKRELNKIRIKLEGLFTEDVTQIEDTQNITEEALRMQLEDVLAAMHSLPEHTEEECAAEDRGDFIQGISEKVHSLEELLRNKEKETEAKKKEIKKLERLGERSKAIQPEINILRMRGGDAVQKKLEDLKKARTEEGNSQMAQKREDLLEIKRDVWKREKEHSKQKNLLEAEMKETERAFLATQRMFSVGDEMRALKGVVGYMYEIISMPKEILAAVSCALPNYLVTIVTETVEDAMDLVRNHRIHQPVISAAAHGAYMQKQKTIPLAPLSQYISSSEQYASLVERVFGQIYFVADFETARTASRTHKVAVITASGEYFGRIGTITGGEDKSSYLFKAYAASKEKYQECIKEGAGIQREKKKAEREYEDISMESSLTSPGYIEDAIFLLENEDFDIDLEILQKRSEIDKIAAQETRDELEKTRAVEKRTRKGEERRRLELRAQEIENRLHKCAGSPEWKEKIAEKGRLESKYRRIQKRILLLDVESKEELSVNNSHINLQKATRETLIQALAVIKKELSEIVSSPEKSEQVLQDYHRTVEKLKELSAAKEKILEMQGQLDLKKEQVINITISQVKSNFEYFFKKLTKGLSVMSVESKDVLDICVSFAGEEMVRSDELSGGQKTVIALCTILAIQRIYEAPFYLMDEFDANLDTQVLMSIVESRVFDERQLFFCTFRGETLFLGDKFFCIKDSKVVETSLESAREEICAFLP